MPWTMKVVSALRRMLTGSPPRGIQPRVLMGSVGLRPPLNGRASRSVHGRPCGYVEGDRPIGIGHAVAVEDLEPLLLPGAGDPEDGDLLGRVEAELNAGLDPSAGDDVNARVGHDRLHHGDLVDAWLLQHKLGQAGRFVDRRVAADLAVVGGP